MGRKRPDYFRHKPSDRQREEQGTDPQLDELRAAGCDAVCEDHASGAHLSGRLAIRRHPLDRTLMRK
jgi:hypothetical protein